MTNIKERLLAHYHRAIEHYGEKAVLGVFLYGSWNYGTNLPDSDVDTKCILIPNLYSLAIKPYEVKHLHIDDEVCECMTIMHMIANWKKQNINFVEVLFTDYFIINPIYEAEWNRIFTAEIRKSIARYDIRAAVLSMAYQALHTVKQDPADLKKIMNATRIAHTLQRLMAEEDSSYKDIIHVPNYIAQIRTAQTPIGDSYVESLIVYFEGAIVRAKDKEVKFIRKAEIKKAELDLYLEEAVLSMIKYRIGAEE